MQWHILLFLATVTFKFFFSEAMSDASDVSDSETSNQQLVLQVTSQQEEINAKEVELQRLWAILAQHHISAAVSLAATQDSRDDSIAVSAGLLGTPSMPQLTPQCAPSVFATVTSSAAVIPVSTTLPMTTTSDPSQISAIPSITAVGATSNVVYYVPTQSAEPPSKVPRLDPEPQSKLDKNLEAKYKGLGPKGSEDLECDPIPTPLADTLNVWFRSIFTNEEIREKLLQAHRPSNALALKPIMINRQVYHSLSGDEKEKDRPLKCIANAICKGSQAVTLVWDKLLKAEISIQDHHKNSDPVELPLPDGSALCVSELIKSLDLALQLLGIANVQVSQKHRFDLKYKLAISAKDLAGKSMPFTDQMFGDNIKEDHANAIKNYQLTHSVVKSSKHSKKSTSHRQHLYSLGHPSGYNRGHDSRHSHHSSSWNGSYSNFSRPGNHNSGKHNHKSNNSSFNSASKNSRGKGGSRKY